LYSFITTKQLSTPEEEDEHIGEEES
jgi:hypothetical protein